MDQKERAGLFEKCEEVVKMLEVLTEYHDVRWERIGTTEYKVPIARNFVSLEYRKDDEVPCVKLKLYGDQGDLRDELVFRHGVKGYLEVKRLYDSAKNSIGE